VLTLIATVAALSAPAAASAESRYVVAPGESLSSVAATDGLSVEQLAAANGLSPEAGLIAGSTLMIPAATGSPESAGAGSEAASSGEPSAGAEPSENAESGGGDGDGDSDDGGPASATSTPAASSSSSGSSSSGSYVVQPGDTLTAIAERSGTSVESLAAANGLEASALLPAGAALTLPGVSGEQSAATSQPVGASAEGSPSEPPFTTEESVTPSEVGSIASENGVPPSFAEAIASQESGFDNGVTSSADARGVMQILPGTWSYINESLTGGNPLSPTSAASNVRGGVLLLNSLLNSTGGNPELAAAGYYQGLPSVLQEGELPSTQQYVSEVLERQQQFGGG
jgi:LysM repeat protein